MDDTAQNPPAQNVQQPVVPTAPPVDTTSPTTPTGSTIPTPASPMGGMNKEFGPVSAAAAVEMPVAEVLQPTEQAPVLEKEVAEAGVEVSKNPEVVDLTMHDKNNGLSHAPVNTPVPRGPSDTIKTPITEQKAEEIVKKEKQPRNAITWIAVMVLRQLKVMHAKMKGGTHE